MTKSIFFLKYNFPMTHSVRPLLVGRSVGLPKFPTSREVLLSCLYRGTCSKCLHFPVPNMCMFISTSSNLSILFLVINLLSIAFYSM